MHVLFTISFIHNILNWIPHTSLVKLELEKTLSTIMWQIKKHSLKTKTFCNFQTNYNWVIVLINLLFYFCTNTLWRRLLYATVTPLYTQRPKRGHNCWNSNNSLKQVFEHLSPQPSSFTFLTIDLTKSLASTVLI